jgi:hypothetical protein
VFGVSAFGISKMISSRISEPLVVNFSEPILSWKDHALEVLQLVSVWAWSRQTFNYWFICACICLWLWRCLISSATISYVCPMLYTHKSTVETSLISCLCSSLCRLCFQCSVQSSTMLSMHFNGHFREHRRVWEPCINPYTPELYLFHPHIRWLKKSTDSFQQV